MAVSDAQLHEMWRDVLELTHVATEALWGGAGWEDEVPLRFVFHLLMVLVRGSQHLEVIRRAINSTH